MNWSEREAACGVGVYAGRGLTFVKGEGAVLRDDAGNEYIDCAAGIGVASVGHGNAELINAVKDQANRLITCLGVFANDVRVQCMEKLISITPDGLGRVFLCNSGAESVEAAIKFARQSTGRVNVVSALRGFHGRTFGALSATPRKDYQEPFAPLVPGFSHVPFNQVEALEQAVNEETAAVILELIQGEGGVRPATREYIDSAAKLCRTTGALLIIDEIQTGFCRTGKMFACESYDLAPDILCLAKGIAGGVPMGAVLVNDTIRSASGSHGSTFGGNPLACAASLAVIEIMQRDRLAERAAELGDDFVRQLKTNMPSVIREIRHAGLMIGIELRTRGTPLLKKLQEGGIIALPAGSTVIRLLPPLVITKEQLDTVLETLRSLLQDESGR